MKIQSEETRSEAIRSEKIRNEKIRSEGIRSEGIRSEKIRSEKICEIVNRAGQVEPVVPGPNDLKSTELDDSLSPNGETRYVNVKHDDTLINTEITHVGLNDPVIFPGALIKGDKVNVFVYPPITLTRAPIKISVSAEGSLNAGSSVTQTISNPQALSNSRQAISDLLKSAIGPNTVLAARAEFETEQVFSDEQMAISVGLDINYGAGSLKTSFNWDKSKKLNHYVATYKQVYFTVDIDTPQSPADLFDSATEVSFIEAAMPRGSRPLYVGTVKYGMLAMLFMESEHDATTMEAALDAAYNGTVDVKVKAGFTSKDVMDTAKLKIVVYGGSAKGLGSTETGLAGFRKLIDASKEYSPSSPGVPIAYVFRNLSDNLIAAVTKTTSYTISTPISIKQKVRVAITSMICTNSDDEGRKNDADIDRWNIKVSGCNIKRDGSSAEIPAQTIYDFATPGEVTVYKGHVWQEAIGRSATLVFDTDDKQMYDFHNKSTLTISGTGREYDSSSKNEHGKGSITLKGDAMFGTQKFSINSADFRYKLTVQVTPG